TTLTISPYKNAELIKKLGQEIGAELFLFYNFKKKNGFKKTIELSKQFNLYRQQYCGCIYSYKNLL
ncbi:MAG: epoxyqueuosine reductase QueH, partial [Candidatus Omnitrophica bacterium]|nr:epoxyqueuosine reductase QueH [Candidatus Omnitrophota bacterium]